MTSPIEAAEEYAAKECADMNEPERYHGLRDGFKAGASWAMEGAETEVQQMFNELVPEEQAFIIDKIKNLLRS